MSLFSKKITLGECRALWDGFTDCHSHILPGVDDGVRNTEESLAILARYEELGIKEVWLTPHIMEDIPNTTSHLKERYQELCEAYQGSTKIHLAAENMLDNLFKERFAARDLLPWGENSDHLLVETSCFFSPTGLQALLSGIASAGYYPIIAHPERYVYMEKDEYRELQEMGVQFQLNVFSLVEMYGTTARKKAEWLLKEGFYSYMGSDLHALRALNTALDKKIDKKIAERLMEIKHP